MVNCEYYKPGPVHGLAAERLAQQRLGHLRLKFKGKEKGHLLQLGHYAKDLGLKRDAAPKSQPPEPPRAEDASANLT